MSAAPVAVHRPRLASIWTLALASLVCAGPAAEDWPQILGPTRNGTTPGPALAERWPTTGPTVVWRRSIGQGLSGPVVAGQRLILFHRVGAREVVEALNASTGTPLWRYDYPTTYRDDFGFDEGPRAVPVVKDGMVFTYGAEGQLHALTVNEGRLVWREDAMKRFGVKKGFFGAAGSPLVDDGRVIANIGGPEAGIVAFDAKSGKVLWSATRDEASYSSATAATLDGRPTAVFLTRNGLVGLESASGRVRFQQSWRARQAASVNVATPLVVGNAIFVSAEYGPGAGVFRVVGDQLTRVWASDDVLSNHYATSVVHDGVLYGFHGRQEFSPSLRAVDWATGTVRWSEDRFNAGSITLVGNRLLIAREGGELVLAEASPTAFRPIARASVLPPTVRALPAVADGYVYLRNERELICIDLRANRS